MTARNLKVIIMITEGSDREPTQKGNSNSLNLKGEQEYIKEFIYQW